MRSGGVRSSMRSATCRHISESVSASWGLRASIRSRCALHASLQDGDQSKFGYQAVLPVLQSSNMTCPVCCIVVNEQAVSWRCGAVLK